jgi:type I restriction enzyme S subunit
MSVGAPQKSPAWLDKTWRVPDTWSWTTLGEIADVVGGGTPRTSEPANYEGGQISWITPADLSGYSEKYISKGARNITERGLASSSARLLPEGTVLFSSRAPIGYVAIAAQPVATNQGFKSFVLPAALDSSYVYYYLRRAKDIAVSMASGTTFLELSGTKAAEIPIPVAPLPEQRRIVAEIETQFTRLDAAVAALERARANLKRYRAAVVDQAVLGRLDLGPPRFVETADMSPDDVEDLFSVQATGNEALAESTAQTDSDGDKFNSPGRRIGKKSKGQVLELDTLPDLPPDWTWSSWGQLSEWITYGFTRPMPHVDNGIPIVTAKNVRDSRIDFENVHYTTEEAFNSLSQKDRPQVGDILLTKDGTLGRGAVVLEDLPFCINQSVAVIWLRSCEIDRRFLLAVIESSLTQLPIAEHSRGAAMPHVSITDLAGFAVPVPPRDVQRQISRELSRRISVIDQVDADIAANLSRIERLKQSILRKAFAGQLVPQDPDDEPASVLLEHIRAERARAASKRPKTRRSKETQYALW